MIHARRGLTAIVVIAVLCGNGCSRTDRIPVHPLSGQVLLNGRPLPNATVFLFPQGGSGSGLRPVGHTRAVGTFEVTPYETEDGAPAGDYRVTVTWAVGKPTDKPEAAADETVMVQSPAVTVLNERLVVSTSEGIVYRLACDGKKWEKVGTSGTKRIVHRLVQHAVGVLLVDAAVPAQKSNMAVLEWISVEAAR